jgi:glycosyltransferase involved in cell wall biosynthesis
MATEHMKPVVVHVITRLCVGGAQLTVLRLCRDLKHDYDVRVVCGPDVGQEGSIFDAVAAEVPTTLLPVLRRSIRPFDDVRALTGLRAFYRNTRPAIIHTHSSKAGLVGRLAAHGSGARVVHTIHGWGHTPLDPPLRRTAFVAAERLAARYSDALLAVSGDVLEEGVRHRIGYRGQYRIVPESVDYSSCERDFGAAKARGRRALQLDPDALVVGWVGRFMPQKDPETLGWAMAEVLTGDTSVRAVFIGDGPQRAQVESVLAKSGCRERAIFAGFRKDVRSLYPAFDVLLHTSRWEGQPRVIQEAIAERVPVVTARAPGTRDLMSTGHVGVEVPPGDVYAMVAGVRAILDDGSRRAPLATEAVRAVSRRNGHEIALREHRRLYSELLTLKHHS